MEHGYVTFMTRIGQFDIGYQAADEWGTVFGDTPGSRPRAKYTGAFGPVNLIAIYQKIYEADTIERMRQPAVDPLEVSPMGMRTDYMLAGIYNCKGGNAGLLYVLRRQTTDGKPTAQLQGETHYARTLHEGDVRSRLRRGRGGLHVRQSAQI